MFLSKKIDLYCASNDIYIIPNHAHVPPRIHNLLFENFKMDFIKSIASDLDSCKDVTKFSVQIKTLFPLQQNVDNSEKSGQMIRASSKLQGGVKSQNQRINIGIFLNQMVKFNLPIKIITSKNKNQALIKTITPLVISTSENLKSPINSLPNLVKQLSQKKL